MLLGLACIDAALLIGSYNVLFWRRFDRWAGLTGSIATLTILWLISSYLLGRYSGENSTERTKRPLRIIQAAAVGLASLICIVVIADWGLKIEDPRMYRSFVVPVLGTTVLGSYAAQSAIRKRGRQKERWLLVASTNEAQIITKELASHGPSSGIKVSVATPDAKTAQELHRFDQLEGIAVSDSAKLQDSNIEELLTLRSRGTLLCSLVNWSEEHLQRVPPELFSSRWLVQAEGFQLQPGSWTWRVKRFGDLTIAAILLITTAPIVAIVALLIMLEDRGPAFYSQVRTGLYGQPYRIWKLRSMHTRAETEGATWAKQQDSRVTRVGRLIRKFRIDELPQLLSVLTGEMSLIGPRPERPEIEEVLEKEIDHYRIRHWVRPGLSGWAQVCYPYGASVEDSRMKLSYDLYYLRNSNIFLDLLILLKTVKLVTRASGASPKS